MPMQFENCKVFGNYLRDRQEWLRNSPRAAGMEGQRINPEMTLLRSERGNPKMGWREVKRREERMVPARDKIQPVSKIFRSQGRVSPAAFCGSAKSADCVPEAVSGLCTSTLSSHHLGTRQDCVLHASEALHGPVTDFGQWHVRENDAITSWWKFEEPVWFTTEANSISIHPYSLDLSGPTFTCRVSSAQYLSTFFIPGKTTHLPSQQVWVPRKLHTGRRKWQPTPVFLPGESHGWRNLVGYSPWGCKEWDTIEWFHFHFFSPISLHQWLGSCDVNTPVLSAPGGLALSVQVPHHLTGIFFGDWAHSPAAFLSLLHLLTPHQLSFLQPVEASIEPASTVMCE